MKKKSVKKKMSGGDLAAALSPAYSIMKGKGPASALAGAGLGGILTMPFAKKQRDRRKKRKMEMASAQIPSGAQSSLSLIHISEPTRPY